MGERWQVKLSMFCLFISHQDAKLAKEYGTLSNRSHQSSLMVMEKLGRSPPHYHLPFITALILFHQGLIALKDGDKISAKKYLNKSLEMNPYFSILQVDVLKEALRNL